MRSLLSFPSPIDAIISSQLGTRGDVFIAIPNWRSPSLVLCRPVGAKGKAREFKDSKDFNDIKDAPDSILENCFEG